MPENVYVVILSEKSRQKLHLHTDYSYVKIKVGTLRAGK